MLKSIELSVEIRINGNTMANKLINVNKIVTVSYRIGG